MSPASHTKLAVATYRYFRPFSFFSLTIRGGLIRAYVRACVGQARAGQLHSSPVAATAPAAAAALRFAPPAR